MRNIQRFFWGHWLAAVGALAAGYVIGQHRIVAALFVVFGMIWLVARQRNDLGTGGLVLTIFLLAGGLGPLFGAPAWMMLIVMVATLGAWDLDHFLYRLSGIDHVDYSTGLGRDHLRRLGMVEGLGFLAGLLALTIHTHIPFGWTALLVLLAIIGVRWLIGYVHRLTEK